MAAWIAVGLILSSVFRLGFSQCATNPTFTSTPTTSTTINNGVSIGTTVVTVAVSDADAGDTPTVFMDSHANYLFNTATNEVTTSRSLASSPGTDTLTFTTTDTCPTSVTSTFTVTIQNNAPVINSLPTTESISEDVTTKTSIHLVDVTDDTGDAVTCSISETNVPFFLKVSDSTVYSKSAPGFDYDTTPSYSLTVVCTDSAGVSDTETLTVSIIENQAPVFSNLQGSASVSTTAAVGSTVFTVTSTDAENDQLFYSMTCNPTPCRFQILDDGAVQLVTSISSETVTGHELSISVTDNKATVGPELLSITVTDINDPVVINNLPLGSALTVVENTGLGTSVYAVSITDADADTFTYTMTSTGEGLTYFSIDTSTGLVSTSSLNNINFEPLDAATSTSFDLSVTVSDGRATDTQVLQVTVANVNEAPVFNQPAYSISVDEGTAGTSLGASNFAVTDPDSSDTKTYTNDCGTYTGFFLMDTSDGSLTFASDYDLDDVSRPGSVTCTVTVTDSGGLTGTTSLTVFINDVNDNLPVFSPATYSLFVSYYASVGTTFGAVTATDADAGNFGVLSYSLDQSSLGDEYFRISSTGDIYTNLPMTVLGNGSSSTVIATATDAGGSSVTATVIIVVSETTTTTSTTTTDRYKTFFEEKTNIAWFIPCMLLVLVIIAFSFWFCCRGEKLNFWKIWKNRNRWRNKYNLRRKKMPPAPVKTLHYVNTVRNPPPDAKDHSWKGR